MNHAVPPNNHFKRTPLHLRLYQLGALILAIGLIAAAIVYFRAVDYADAGYILGLSGDKRYTMELQRIGGQAAVAAVQFDQWFDSLWHGKQLAFTLAFLTIAAAALCFLLGDRLSAGVSDQTAEPSDE